MVLTVWRGGQGWDPADKQEIDKSNLYPLQEDPMSGYWIAGAGSNVVGVMLALLVDMNIVFWVQLLNVIGFFLAYSQGNKEPTRRDEFFQTYLIPSMVLTGVQIITWFTKKSSVGSDFKYTLNLATALAAGVTEYIGWSYAR